MNRPCLRPDFLRKLFNLEVLETEPFISWLIVRYADHWAKETAYNNNNNNNSYKISREKLEPEPGFEPRTSGFLARRSAT